MSKLTPLTPDQASDTARQAMEQAEQAFGFVPNLLGVMAHAPAVPDAYLQLHQSFQSTSLSDVEQQVVLLTTAFENECHYCVAAHSGGALQAGVDEGIVEALRNGEALPDARLEALRTFTRAVVRDRGWVSDDEVRAFLDAGFEKPQLLEVILGVTQKTLSNYVNHVADTPLDEPLSDFAWSKPEEAATTVAAD